MQTLYRAFDVYQQSWFYVRAYSDQQAAFMLRKQIVAKTGRWKVSNFDKKVVNSQSIETWVPVSVKI